MWNRAREVVELEASIKWVEAIARDTRRENEALQEQIEKQAQKLTTLQDKFNALLDHLKVTVEYNYVLYNVIKKENQ